LAAVLQQAEGYLSPAAPPCGACWVASYCCHLLLLLLLFLLLQAQSHSLVAAPVQQQVQVLRHLGWLLHLLCYLLLDWSCYCLCC
jgi:hypothetical protein